ncbi:hypothetical protein ADK74_18990 [Streptomyces decoyicus]|nr:hypothetical protein ADK74_18990 [Streptomyces decoyicus]
MTWIYIRQEFSSLVDELDTLSFLVEVPAIGVHRPGVEDLVGQEAPGQRQRERQSTESVCDCRSLLQRAALRRQVA